MKFLILGCNGMAGHMISLHLQEKGHDVTGFARNKRGYVKTIAGDVSDKESLRKIIDAGEYDSVVNCIGILNLEAEYRKADAVYLNAYLPHYLQNITEETQTQIIHLSTDCVFSGRKGQYAEDDFKDGETFYARTKALGEIENEKDFTIRTSIIGPDLYIGGIGLLNWFMKQKGEVAGYSRVFWTGITTLQLSKCIERISKEKLNGLYHMVPSSVISKYDLLVLCSRYLRKDDIKIKRQEYPVIDKSLARTRREFDYGIPDYQQMAKELAEWIRLHKELYPHYEI